MPWLEGFLISGSLIVAIGAQNAWVLSQGLRRQHVGTIALTCALIDAMLICAGVAGLGVLINAHPEWLALASGGGALFLTLYGLRSAFQAMRPGAMATAGGEPLSRRQTVVTALAISLLNPHVYLDTVLLIGSIGGQYPPSGRLVFAAGAITASFIWFFSLAYGAGRLAPLFSRPAAWRILDALVAAIMWGLATALWQRTLSLLGDTPLASLG
ncbi:LysE/ArgO family amino acid transporter [Hahella sp. SMD15-11]|uniref:LysE/ArgO family amino acid transporter n=1 Tax=Thermohahella caldifontis TaxID=3142973 RepID=A0AB39UWQ3_9GAMM